MPELNRHRGHARRDARLPTEGPAMAAVAVAVEGTAVDSVCGLGEGAKRGWAMAAVAMS